MIEKLSIRNFQSHKKTTLDLHKGVNVIIGNTDSGKSAVIRALRWVTTNSPSGDAFRSWDGGDTSVSIRLENEDIIKRTKGTENKYVFGGMKFTGIGTDVPAPIKEAINMNDTNLQVQLDSPFLLSNTSGDVAKFFNRIANLDKIDSGQKNVKSWMRTIVQDIKVNAAVIADNETKIKSTKYIYKLEIDLEVLEANKHKVQKLYQRAANLRSLVTAAKNVNAELLKLDHWAGMEVLVTKITDLYAEVTFAKESKGMLLELVKKIDTTTSTITKFEKIKKADHLVTTLITSLASLKQLTNKQERLHALSSNAHSIKKETKKLLALTELEFPVSTVLTLIASKTKQIKKQKKLTTLVLSMEDVDFDITKGTKQITKLDLEFTNSFPEHCPLCGSNEFHKH